MNNNIDKNFDGKFKRKFLFDLFMLIVFLIIVFLYIHISIQYKSSQELSDFFTFMFIVFKIFLICFVLASIIFDRKYFLIGWKINKLRFICFLTVEFYLIGLSLFVIFVKRAFDFYVFILTFPFSIMNFLYGYQQFYPVSRTLFYIIIGVDILVWIYSYIILPICFLTYGIDSIMNILKNKKE